MKDDTTFEQLCDLLDSGYDRLLIPIRGTVKGPKSKYAFTAPSTKAADILGRSNQDALRSVFPFITTREVRNITGDVRGKQRLPDGLQLMIDEEVKLLA